MISRQEQLANRILSVQGVKGFLLVRNDGQVIASKIDMSIPLQSLAAMIILSGRDCDALKSIIGFSGYHHLVVCQEKEGRLFVFPIQDYYLGVLYRFQEYDSMFIKEIKQLLDTLHRPAIRETATDFR